jgi:lysophospholipase L1-like esterase
MVRYIGRVMVALQRILLVLSGLVASAVVVELALEFNHERIWQQKRQSTRPFYSWSFHTSNGQSLGGSRGILKLMIHPLVGYTNLPDQSTRQFSINSLGFRGDEVTSKQPGSVRIVVVGGSAAFGTGLDDDSETFSSQLEAKLDGAEAINAAVIGHRSGQELSYLVSELVDLDPDWVISLGGFNDFSSVGGVRWNDWMDVNGSQQVENQLLRLAGLVDRGPITRLGQLYRVVFPQIANRLSALQLPGIHARAAEEFGVFALDTVAERYVDNIEKMSGVARAFGARFLCVLQPSEYAMHINPTEDPYLEFRTYVKTEAKLRGVPLLDLNEHADRIEANMFMDNVHLDARGNQVMAQIVAPVLRRPGGR